MKAENHSRTITMLTHSTQASQSTLYAFLTPPRFSIAGGTFSSASLLSHQTAD